MAGSAKIALVGDYDPSVTAHIAIPKALDLTASRVSCSWVGTETVDAVSDLAGYDAFWVVPASPYRNVEGALLAIRHARETGKTFLGTCGGYQHAVLEFTQSVLGYAEAGNAEVDPDCAMPIVGPLSCPMVEVSGDIRLVEGTQLARLHGSLTVSEGYHCSYGVNADYLDLFEGSAMTFVGFDDAGEPRAFELANHPFFVGTAYQPERAALTGRSHPLVEEFAISAARHCALAA